MSRRIRIVHFAVALLVLSWRAGVGDDRSPAPNAEKIVRIGGVAYSPETVTVFQGLCQYLSRNGLASDYVLYSNYDALVAALDRSEIHIAWNTPLAHAQYHVGNKCASQTLVMRDVDRDMRSVLVVRADAGIKSLADLAGKKLVLGSSDSAEATVLPLHYLKQEKIDLTKMSIVSLDKEVDFKGNPCCSLSHVLQAVQKGRGDAGIITESLWKSVKSDPSKAVVLKELWTSPPFSHCVFTASAGFDRQLGEQFTRLMTSMDPKDPQTADVMRLEGTKKWLPGEAQGFADLVEAIRSKPVD